MVDTPQGKKIKSFKNLKVRLFQEVKSGNTLDSAKRKKAETSPDNLWEECFRSSGGSQSKKTSDLGRNSVKTHKIDEGKMVENFLDRSPAFGSSLPAAIQYSTSGQAENVQEIQYLGTFQHGANSEVANSELREKLAKLKVEKDLHVGLSQQEIALKASDPAIVSVIMAGTSTEQNGSVLDKIFSGGNSKASSVRSVSTTSGPEGPQFSPVTAMPPLPPPPPVGAPISYQWLHDTYQAFLNQAVLTHRSLTENVSLLTQQNVDIKKSVVKVERIQQQQAEKINSLQRQSDFVERNVRNGSTLLIKQHGLGIQAVKDPEKRKETIKKLLDEALSLDLEERAMLRSMKSEWIRPKDRRLYNLPGYQPTLRVFFHGNYIWEYLCTEVNFGSRLKKWHQKNGRPKFAIYQDLSRKDQDKKFFAVDVLRRYKQSYPPNNQPKIVVTQFFGLREGEGKGVTTPYVKLKEKYGNWFPPRSQPYVLEQEDMDTEVVE